VSVRVLLVDDMALVREGFRMVLEATPGIEVVGEAGDGAAAVAEAERLRPDVVLMDVRMPDVDGIEATRRIVALDGPPVRVLLLSTFDLEELLLEALRAGVSGVALKDTPPEVLAAGITAVARDDALVGAEETVRLIAAVARVRPASPAPPGLTDGERALLGAVASGRPDAELDGDVPALLAKLGVRDRVHAVLLAHEARVVG
jgi:DNA-binding NarL/FixJ family response regulator